MMPFIPNTEEQRAAVPATRQADPGLRALGQSDG